MPTLHVYVNDEFRWKFTLFDKEVLIGRDHGNHVVLPQPNVSRHHASIRKKGNDFVIQDESGKGLQVNNKTVSQAILKHDDLIHIKAFQLVFKLEEKDQHYEKQTAPKGTRGIPAWRLPFNEDQTLQNDQPSQADKTLHNHQPRQEDHTRTPLVRCEIRVISGTDQGLSYPIREEIITVGRSPRNNLVLKDPSVSSFHLKITPKEKGVELQDVGSTNGTYVEDHLVLNAVIPMGSEIKIGETILILAVEDKMKPEIVGLSGQNLNRTDDYQLIEKRVIERSLNAHRGDRNAVAKIMGISLSSLNEKIGRHGITE